MLKNVFTFFTVVFISLSCFADDFYYNKQLIYEKRFDKLYDQFKDMLFTDGKKIYDLRTGCTDRFVPDANAMIKLGKNSSGSIKGEVFKIIDKDTFILQIGKILVCVSGNVDTSTLEDKTEFDGYLSSDGKYDYADEKGKKKPIRKFVNLTPVTKEIFKDYIKDKKLFTYEKVEKTVPAQTVLCPKCTGKGSVMQKLGKGRAGFRKCKVCNGKGNIPGKFKQQITWERVDLD